jgi:hypothetical protein
MTDQKKENDGKTYQIVVKGQLKGDWAQLLDGFALLPRAGGTTTITGPIEDQSALQGLINRLSDLNMELISIGVLPQLAQAEHAD